MRTNEERIRLIHERTAEIRKEQKNRPVTESGSYEAPFGQLVY